MYGGETEIWEHVWEKCGRWGGERSWQEMVLAMVLGVGDEGENWLRKLESFRGSERGKVKKQEREREDE